MKTVLVTGAYGYIGSHVVKSLAEHGYTITALDIKTSYNDIKKYIAYYGYHEKDIRTLFKVNEQYDCVVHLAGLISVEESVKHPQMYVKTNILGTQNVLDHYQTDNIVFASTAAAFNPNSPYAYSKLMAESLIRSNKRQHTIFRFFNVAGSNGEFGQIGQATHIIRIAAEVAAGKRPAFIINGNDWDTVDGTCVRDYVHVEDLVDGIVKAVDQPLNNSYDCIGTGTGYSVNDVLSTMMEVCGKRFKVFNGPRREGDVSSLIMDPSNAYIQCKRTLYHICESAYKFEMRK